MTKTSQVETCLKELELFHAFRIPTYEAHHFSCNYSCTGNEMQLSNQDLRNTLGTYKEEEN